MKRRDFLKLLGTLIVAPGIVLATIKVKPKWPGNMNGKWKNYSAMYPLTDIEKRKMLEKFRKAFRNTKFISPIYYKGKRIYCAKELYHETPN